MRVGELQGGSGRRSHARVSMRARASQVPSCPTTMGPVPRRVLGAERSQSSISQLQALAHAHARRGSIWPVGRGLDAAHNAHYANTIEQLSRALQSNYNSIEGDVRLRNGVPVMAHDSGRTPELTFEEWATIVYSSGCMLRVDVKEAAALAYVAATLRRLGIPDERITFNVSTRSPLHPANQPIGSLKQLRAGFPNAWITFNVELPLGPFYDIAGMSAMEVGGKVGVAIQGPLATPAVVRRLRQYFTAVNIWNHPSLWAPHDIVAETQRFRTMGVNGMIDLRRSDDPLAKD